MQVILIAAAVIRCTSLQQFTMLYSLPPCPICPVLSELFVMPEFFWVFTVPAIFCQIYATVMPNLADTTRGVPITVHVNTYFSPLFATP